MLSTNKDNFERFYYICGCQAFMSEIIAPVRVTEPKLVLMVTDRACGACPQKNRTWILLTEAAEGGWGIAGTALGKLEFADLVARAASTRTN
jgi:phenylpyruvate tautomerase PptA (4-oxalocrotonate tautomerase family)